ncbi:MAG TPA: hypothetical protein VGD51_03865 [Nocardioidaceae bacterium]
MSDQEQRLNAQTGTAAVCPGPADRGIHVCDRHARLHANGAA